MKAIVSDEPGGIEALRLGEVSTPVPADDELLVRVRATAVNRADILQRKGLYPPPPGVSSVLGLEMAGDVVETGSDCQGWETGDRVFALLQGGGYAEFAVVKGEMAMPIPANLNYEEAAAIAEVFLTAFQTLFWLGRLQKGERVLIHAGASGVGTAAIQLARQAGAQVWVTAGSDRKTAVCEQLGAQVAVNYRERAFDEVVADSTNGEGVDVILDPVGASYWPQNVKSLGMDGRLVVIGALGGVAPAGVDFRQLLGKRLQIIGTTLRSRSETYRRDLIQGFAQYALPMFEQGALKPVIDRILPWTDVGSAHQAMEANENIGKIVLSVTAPKAMS